MPGIIGFCDSQGKIEKPVLLLDKMREIITHKDFYIKDELFSYDNFYASRSHINIIQKAPQPSASDGIYCWLDGEFYNQEELQGLIEGSESISDPELLLCLYNKQPGFEFLKKIDGIYSAVIFDTKNRKIHLITDRYGLRHLYWMNHRGRLAWSSEIKSLTLMPDYTPTINQQGLEHFIEWGYFFGTETWFNEISLLSPGTLLSYDVQQDSITTWQYWSYDEIKTMESCINEEELIDALIETFVSVVNRHSQFDGKVGLTLSGGLDSRAILAAIPTMDYSVPAITFGRNGCDDIKLAVLAAKVKGVEHHIFEISSNNWFFPRLEGIWYTDGQLSFLHMHGINFMSSIKSLIDINLNGFAGDAVLGGTFIGNKNHTVKEKFKNHVRRFTTMGTKLLNVYIESRPPFMNNKLFEIALSIPENKKKDSYVYKKLLLKRFPIFFENIPWQKTGLPISSSKTSHFIKLIENKIKRELKKLGIKTHESKNYTDYPNWLRQEPAKSTIKNILASKNALYKEWISQAEVLEILEEHISGKEHTEKIGRFLTMEIWFQQIIKGQFKVYPNQS